MLKKNRNQISSTELMKTRGKSEQSQFRPNGLPLMDQKSWRNLQKSHNIQATQRMYAVKAGIILGGATLDHRELFDTVDPFSGTCRVELPHKFALIFSQMIDRWSRKEDIRESDKFKKQPRLLIPYYKNHKRDESVEYEFDDHCEYINCLKYIL